MQKIIKLLDRWYRRKAGNQTVEVFPAAWSASHIVMRFIYEYLRGSNGIHASDVLANIKDKLNCIIQSETSTVLLAFVGNVPVGMVIVGLADSDMGDDRITGAVSYLYVEPAYRNTDDVVVSLLRAAGAKLLESGCKVIRLTVDTDNPKLVDHYLRMMDFKPKHCLMICETKEG